MAARRVRTASERRPEGDAPAGSRAAARMLVDADQRSGYRPLTAGRPVASCWQSMQSAAHGSASSRSSGDRLAADAAAAVGAVVEAPEGGRRRPRGAARVSRRARSRCCSKTWLAAAACEPYVIWPGASIGSASSPRRRALAWRAARGVARGLLLFMARCYSHADDAPAHAPRPAAGYGPRMARPRDSELHLGARWQPTGSARKGCLLEFARRLAACTDRVIGPPGCPSCAGRRPSAARTRPDPTRPRPSGRAARRRRCCRAQALGEVDRDRRQQDQDDRDHVHDRALVGRWRLVEDPDRQGLRRSRR